MSPEFILFCLGIFLVDLSLVYVSCYVVSYKLFDLEHRVNETKLFYSILAITIITSIALFPTFFRLLGIFFIRG